VNRDKLKVAVIGVGYGERHVAALTALQDVEVVALCSRRPESVAAAAERHGVAFSTTEYAEVLALEALDAISIAAPAGLHREIALAAIASGRHVICEKPLATTADAAKEMLDAAEAAGVVHATCYDWRDLPDARKLHRLLEEGCLGNLYHVRLEWMSDYHADPSTPWTWRHSRAEAGFGVLGDMSHVLDEIHWHLGPVGRVAADLRTIVAEAWDGERGSLRANEVEDAAAFVAVTAAGVQVVGHLSRCAPGARYRRTVCFGSKGFAELTIPDELDRWTTTLVCGRTGDAGRVDRLHATSAQDAGTTHERFAAAIRDRGVRVGASFVDGVAALRVSEALRESSESGRWVELPPAPAVDGSVAYSDAG